ELRVTVLNIPAALWARWVREHGHEPLPEGLPLRLVLVGGEAVPADAAALWHQTPLAPVVLLAGYGPTEAGITATRWTVEPAGMAALASGSTPIGWPLAGHTAHLLDADGELVPSGVPGELHLGGLLALGYLGNPAVTAERYRPDPFAAESGARL